MTTQDKSISVQIKRVYGNVQIYPVCDAAQKFAQLAGTKTLTDQAIKLIKSLGFEVVVKSEFPATL